MNKVSEFNKMKNWHILLLIIIASTINMYLLQNYIMTNQVYYNLFSDQLELYRIDQQVEQIKKFSAWAYLFNPVIVFLKILLTSLIIQLPLLLKFIDIPFKKIFRANLIAYFPIILLEYTRTFRLFFFPVSKIDQNQLAIIPFSIAHLLDAKKYSAIILSFLGNFNIFSLFWCVIIAVYIAKDKKIRCLDSMLISTSVWVFLLFFQWVFILYLLKVQA